MEHIKIEFSGDISTLDYNQICRACLLQEDSLISVFSEKPISGKVTSIVEMITACASVQIFEGDGLPSHLCSNCFNQLHQAYAFRQQFEKADATLRNNAYKSIDDTSHFLDDTQSTVHTDDEDLKSIKDEEICKKEHVKKNSEKSHKNLKKKKSGKLNKADDVVDKSTFKCKKCDDTFENNVTLKSHVREKHPYKAKEKVCPICSKSVIVWRLAVHMRSHTQEKPYACNICGLTFSVNGNLTRHKKLHTGERPHTCPICSKGFSRSFSLTEHLRIHTRETPFHCIICSKSFTQSGQFRLHVKKHGDPRNVNRKPGKSQSGLKSETEIQNDKKFLCSECGKSFTQIGSLKAHAVIHTGTKPYKCTVCDKSFNLAVTLKTHILLHTGEKPFSCTLCDKVFTQRHHLKYHLRTHTGEKPYECSFCGKRFALKNNMTVHVRTHTGETPYHCSVCGRGFYDSSSMKKHQKGHGIKTNAGKSNEIVPQD